MTVFTVLTTADKPFWAALSDASVTTAEIEKHSSETIPARFGLPSSDFAGRTRRLLSKCVVREDCCVHWAGSVLEARRVVERLLETPPDSLDEFNDVLWQFDECHQKGVAICFSHYDDGGFIYSYSWNCDQRNYPSFDSVIGGSGTADVVDSIEHSQFSVAPRESFFSDSSWGISNSGKDALTISMSLIASLLDIERFDPSSNLLDFGAAYEVVLCDASGFYKVPFSFAETYVGEKNKELGLPRDRVLNVVPLSNGFAVLVGVHNEVPVGKSGFDLEKFFLIPELTTNSIPDLGSNQVNIETAVDILRIVGENGIDRDTYVGHGLVHFTCSNKCGHFEARTAIKFDELSDLIRNRNVSKG